MIKNKKELLPGLIMAVITIVVTTQLFEFDLNINPKYTIFEQDGQIVTGELNSEKININELNSAVIPEEGVDLAIQWGDLGKKMIDDGVIDEEKFRKLFQNNLSNDEDKILSKSWNEPIIMNQENSRFILDILWAFGLANKNDILENGEMTDEKYGGDAGKFAATGGWSLSKTKPMDHYSMHSYVVLTPEQQALVDKVSRGIFRPCCGNSTHFPDCNHGMAMLGLLELMAANDLGEEEMYKIALKVNAYWFPQTYIDIATYFAEQGTEWKDVDPKLALSQEYSSSAGYRQTKEKTKSIPQPIKGGGGCGV